MPEDSGLPAILVVRHGWRKNPPRGSCQRCGAEGAALLHPFYTACTSYRLCRTCTGWLMVGWERKGQGLHLRNNWWGWTRFLSDE